MSTQNDIPAVPLSRLEGFPLLAMLNHPDVENGHMVRRSSDLPEWLSDWDRSGSGRVIPREPTPAAVREWITCQIDEVLEYQERLERDGRIESPDSGTDVVRNAYRLVRVLGRNGIRDLPQEPHGDFSLHAAVVELDRIHRAIEQCELAANGDIGEEFFLYFRCWPFFNLGVGRLGYAFPFDRFDGIVHNNELECALEEYAAELMQRGSASRNLIRRLIREGIKREKLNNSAIGRVGRIAVLKRQAKTRMGSPTPPELRPAASTDDEIDEREFLEYLESVQDVEAVRRRHSAERSSPLPAKNWPTKLPLIWRVAKILGMAAYGDPLPGPKRFVPFGCVHWFFSADREDHAVAITNELNRWIEGDHNSPLLRPFFRLHPRFCLIRVNEIPPSDVLDIRTNLMPRIWTDRRLPRDEVDYRELRPWICQTIVSVGDRFLKSSKTRPPVRVESVGESAGGRTPDDTYSAGIDVKKPITYRSASLVSGVPVKTIRQDRKRSAPQHATTAKNGQKIWEYAVFAPWFNNEFPGSRLPEDFSEFEQVRIRKTAKSH